MSVTAGPRVEAAHPPFDVLRRPAPIDETVFLLQNRREGCQAFILFAWRQRTSLSRRSVSSSRRAPMGVSLACSEPVVSSVAER